VKAKPHLAAITHATITAIAHPLQALTSWLG
jgi:hypothetical protein